MATEKQRRWRAIFASRYGGKKKRSAHRARSGKMARRGFRRGRSKGGLGSILSTKNIAYTLVGAYVAPKVGVNSAVGAGLGSYLASKNLVNAGIAYIAAPIVLGKVLNLTGTGGTEIVYG